MKIVTANGKKTIKISKVEWEYVGRTAGWIGIKQYKISKNTLSLPIEAVSFIDTNLNLIMEELSKARGVRKRINTLILTSPYDNKQYKIEIYVSSKFIPSLKGGVVEMVDDPNKQHYRVEIMSPSKESKKADYTAQDVRSVLIHEITHVIDPKIRKEQFENNYALEEGESKKKSYSSDPKEIDAFQQTMVNSIINSVSIGKININEIYNWIRQGKIDNLINKINLSQSDYSWLLYWEQNNPQTITLLKQRVYSALQKITPNQAPNQAPN